LAAEWKTFQESNLAAKIAVLLGGTSAERDVSLVTGIEIAKALSRTGYQVRAIDCAFGDRIIDHQIAEVAEIIHAIPSDIDRKRTELDRNILVTMQYLLKEKFDAAFVALHGGYGENGQLQSLLELMSIPYTGSGPLASVLGMNKHLSKTLFQKNGIPTAQWIKIEKEEKVDSTAFESLGYPLVIKPNDQGSTVGLTVVNKPEEVAPALQRAFQYGSTVIAETFIPGREMTVSILSQEALPVIEIIPEHGIYDYECKYQKGKSQYVVPAEIPPEVTQRVQHLAQQAFLSLECRDYARVDFRLSPENQPYCLEVNTLPGMTPTSLVPKAARAVGIDFNELIDRIIQMALKRGGGKQRFH